MALLAPLDVARRLVSLAGMLLLIALALTLLWQVWEHHHQAEPYESDGPVTVRLDGSPVRFVNFAVRMS